MARRLIAIDIDDVVAGFCPAFCEYANRKWGEEIHPGIYTEDWGKMFSIDREEWQKRSDQALKDMEFYSGLEVIEGAQRALGILRDDFDVVAVTSRHTAMKETTKMWLENYFPGLINDIHFLGAYESIDGYSSHNKTKDEICLKLGVSYLIDDQPKHVLSAHRAGVGAILFGDYSWNRTVNVDDGVKRAVNWDEVLEYLASILNALRARK
ncbi:hypothetical protein FWF89_02900 [Candidatus Saccharibacteria bacterium]|nr:hypothetical protein [Candidatus Saccharibacteria bacterium]